MKFCTHTILMEIAKLLNDDITGELDHVRLTKILEKARLDRLNPGANPLMIVEVQYLKAFEDGDIKTIMEAYKKECLDQVYEMEARKSH